MKHGTRKDPVRLPLIKERLNQVASGSINKSLKLEKINRQKHIALIDINKINKIEREYKQITTRHEEDHKEPTRDEMRESKLLLLKNIAPVPTKRQNQLSLLSSLVEYSPKLKPAIINSNNLSLSPSKRRA